MGSGNKDKRRRQERGQAAQPRENAVNNPLWHKKSGPPPPAPGVVFELEPNADEIFRNSLQQWDKSLENFDDEFPQPHEPAPAKSARRSLVEIDLHRLTLEEALWRVDAELDEAITARVATTFKIITGKGLHSGPSGSVLVREVHRHITERYARHIQQIDESPADVTIGGVPLRGHFTVTVKKS